MISLKLIELEGGYNRTRLKSHPVFRELKKRKSYCWSNYKYTVGVFANTIYSIDGSKYLKEPILKIMLIYKSLLWILNKIQVQNAATSCIRLMGKNIFFLTGMEEIFKLKPFTNSIL